LGLCIKIVVIDVEDTIIFRKKEAIHFRLKVSARRYIILEPKAMHNRDNTAAYADDEKLVITIRKIPIVNAEINPDKGPPKKQLRITIIFRKSTITAGSIAIEFFISSMPVRPPAIPTMTCWTT
jgi:hypothetical protein